MIGLAIVSASRTCASTAVDALLAKRLAAGEIIVDVTAVPDTSGGRVTALLDLPASQRRVWEVMLDCKRSVKIADNLKSCKVTSADPNGRWDVREHLVQWVWPLPTIRSVFRSEYLPFDSIRFQRVEGDLKALIGIWRLESLDSGRVTRLRYEAIVDPGVTLPGFLVRSTMEADFRKTLAALRREIVANDPR